MMKTVRDLSFLAQAEIRNMSIECDRVNGINLSQGMCDLPLEKILEDGTKTGMRAGYNHYTRFDGIPELRTQIANKAKHFNHITVDAETEICVSCGATGALFSTCYALFNAGDEIILFEPYYAYHEHTLIALDLKPVFATLYPPEWNFQIKELEKLVTPRTRAIMINTPVNPCGKIFNSEELEQLADFAIQNDLMILTDEIYEYITYDQKKHISPASIDRIRDRTVTISGYSKTFSITGWRIGYTIASAEITQRIGLVNDLLYVCAPAPLQFSVAQAIETLDDHYYINLAKDYQNKRDLLCETLKQTGLTPYVPDGAYYILADVSLIPGHSGKERAMWLLNNCGIATVPGETFYKGGKKGHNMVRFCFAKDIKTIECACKLLTQKCNEWRK